MRCIGLDVHREFCEVAVAEAGEVRLAGRVQTQPETLALFAQSLSGGDEVALEATGNALGIARIIEPHVGRVVLANPKGGQGDHPGGREDRQDRRAYAREAARRRLLARGLAAGRADADPAPPDLGSGAAGPAAHTCEEPGARDLDPQSEAQAASERSLRRPRPALARRAGPAGR
jgi:hypothetical protein